MFLWKNKTNQENVQQIDTDVLLAEAAAIQGQIDTLTGQIRFDALNKLGSLYFQAGRNDEAIQYYELSLAENKALGKAYTDLMKLYNIKRRQAAENKDEADTKLYLDKINNLMQLSKDIIRGKE